MKMCSVEGCNGKHYGKGYCERHYQQFKKHGKILCIESLKEKNEIKIHDDYIEVFIKNKDREIITSFKVDKDVYEEIKNVTWSIKANRPKDSKDDVKYYVFNNKKGLLHRYIMNAPKGLQVDHLNRDTMDNRKSNLRVCTASENQCNVPTKRHNQLGLKNISLTKSGTYQVRITKNHVVYNTYFNTVEEAIEYRDKRLKELHEEFASNGE